MFSFTGYQRYLLRELLPRTVVMLLCTFFLSPYVPGLSFRGGLGMALFVAIFFTAYFWLWGSQIMAVPAVDRFIAGLESKLALGAFYMATVILMPLPAVLLPVLVAPQIFVCTAWYGLLIWVVALNVCCALTHDYGRK
jgi:hypothetical protein